MIYDQSDIDETIYPPEEWFLAYYGEGMNKVAFTDNRGATELMRCEWFEGGNYFRVCEIPLRVDGVSVEDCIEVEWIAGDSIPHFIKVSDKGGNKTIRFKLEDDWKVVKSSFEHLLNLEFRDFRQQDNLFVISFYDTDTHHNEWFRDLVLEGFIYSLPARIENTPDWIEIETWVNEWHKEMRERNSKLSEQLKTEDKKINLHRKK